MAGSRWACLNLTGTARPVATGVQRTQRPTQTTCPPGQRDKKQIISQGHQTVRQQSLTQRGCCLHTDLKSLATLINGTLVFNNATLIMFTYLALLISYVSTVFYTIYCILSMSLCYCSSIYLYVYILIPFLYLDLCVLGSCGIIRWHVRYWCVVGTRYTSILLHSQ